MSSASDLTGPSGHSFAAVLVRQEGGTPSADAVLAVLREVRFSGWLTDRDTDGDGWMVAVAAEPGVVASGRRSVVGVGEALAGLGTTFAVAVERDRQLALVAWAAGDEVGRYVSDPSVGLPSRTDVLSDPVGSEGAAAFAAACGRPDVGVRLEEVLDEELDAETAIESERLSQVCALLGLPSWLVSAWALPRPAVGPVRAELTRVGAGVVGPPAALAGRAALVVRRRLTPPPVLDDPPRGPSMDDIEPWML